MKNSFFSSQFQIYKPNEISNTFNKNFPSYVYDLMFFVKNLY
jgi:hypothetical protein